MNVSFNKDFLSPPLRWKQPGSFHIVNNSVNADISGDTMVSRTEPIHVLKTCPILPVRNDPSTYFTRFYTCNDELMNKDLKDAPGTIFNDVEARVYLIKNLPIRTHSIWPSLAI